MGGPTTSGDGGAAGGPAPLPPDLAARFEVAAELPGTATVVLRRELRDRTDGRRYLLERFGSGIVLDPARLAWLQQGELPGLAPVVEHLVRAERHHLLLPLPPGTRLTVHTIDRTGAPGGAATAALAVLRGLVPLLEALDGRLAAHLALIPALVHLGGDGGETPTDRVTVAATGLLAVDGAAAIAAEQPSAILRYLAPEVLVGRAGPAADRWSLGVLLSELIAGVHPLAAVPDQQLDWHLHTAQLPVEPGAVVGEGWSELLQGLLSRDAERRVSLAEVAAFAARASAPAPGPDADGSRRAAVGVVAEGASPEPATPTTDPADPADPNDPTGPADPADPADPTDPAGRAAPSLTDGRTDQRVLARALVADWDLGAERVWYGQLPEELASDREVGPVLAQLERSPWDRHGRLVRLVHHLDPSLPPSYRGVALSAVGLAGLAARVVRDGVGSPAAEVLASLLDQEVIAAVAELTGGRHLARLERDWQAAREELTAMLAAHAEHPPSAASGPTLLADAWLLELLTDPDARERTRQQLLAIGGESRLPAWFRAAREASATPGALLAASLLLPQVRAELAAAHDRARWSSTTGRMATDAAGAAAGAAAGTTAGAAATGGAAGAADPTGGATRATPREGLGERRPQRPPGAHHDPDADRWLARLVAVSLGAIVAAVALRWPLVTGLAVLLWLVVDRVGSWLADPFLRLVGGWPPRLRGWAVAWLPVRLVGLVLRAPWRLLADLILLVVSFVVVDRLLVLTGLLTGAVAPDAVAVGRAELVARWFVPVWAGAMVWQITRERRGAPPLRLAGSLAGLLRVTPMGVRAGLVVVASAALVLSARAPVAEPWAPYDDHRDLASRLLAGVGLGGGPGGLVPPTLPSLPGPGPAEPDGEAPVVVVRWQVVDATALNVRVAPGTAADIVATVPGGTELAGTGASQDVAGQPWHEVVLTDGSVGWASGRYLSPVDG